MGKVIMSGVVPLLTEPVHGIAASTLSVGSTVKLMESGSAVEYLVVNQGKPGGSSLYDDSCDGTWILRKAIHSSRAWNSSDTNTYASSAINTWLNGDFFNTLGSVERATVKQVKIPYCVGGGSSTVNSGANGLSVKVFPLGAYETGWTTGDNSDIPVDGACTLYFAGAANSQRVANLNGSASFWWLRSANTNRSGSVWFITAKGGLGYGNASSSYGVRPALILPKTALFDETTMILKGVA